MSPPPAMVLAAGLGTRLGEMGGRQAKATLEVGGEPLLRRLLVRLRAGGIERAVINLHHLGDQVRAVADSCGDLGMEISYSPEEELLDVGGGIANALPLLGEGPFIVANSDILSGFDFAGLAALAPRLGDRLGHLVLGSNPEFRPQGDFSLEGGVVRRLEGGPGLTYIGVALYSPRLFSSIQPGSPAPMWPLWSGAIDAGKISGESHKGDWFDTGTPERLELARRALSPG